MTTIPAKPSHSQPSHHQSGHGADDLRQLYCPPTTLVAWDFTNQELAEAINGGRLLCPSLDLSNTCNLNCPYCFTEPADSPHKKRRPDELSEGELLSVIKQMATAGARTINIIGAGEPLLDPRFERIARFIHQLGIRLLVATNGLELVRRPGLLTLLNTLEANIALKLNTLDPTLEDAMVGKAGYAAQRDQAMSALLAAGFNNGVPSRLAIITIVTTGNQQEIASLHEYCRMQNIVFIAGPYMPAGRTAAIHPHDGKTTTTKDQPAWTPLDPAALARIREQLREWDHTRGYPVVNNPAYTSGLPCVQSLGVHVDATGTIWPCPTRQQLSNGELRNKPLGKVDNADANHLSKIYRDHPYMHQVRAAYRGDCTRNWG